VGSTISVLKPYILTSSIPKNGISLIQPAIRTQQLKNLCRKDGYFSEWASYFIALGTLVNYESLSNTLNDAIQFLSLLGIPDKDILIRLSSQDKDLLTACFSTVPHIALERDSQPRTYYKHKYGLDEHCIQGRNFNFAIRDVRTDDYKDIGNLIVIEKKDVPIAVESAFGMSAIISRIFGCFHTTQATIISEFVECSDYDHCKFADCIAVVVHLILEGVRPNSSKMQGRILKKYLDGIWWFCKELEISMSKLFDIIDMYTNTQMHPNSFSTRDVIKAIKTYYKLTDGKNNEV